MQPDESELWVFSLQNIYWWFPSKDGLPCRAHLAIHEGNFACHSCGCAAGISWIEVRDATKQLQCTGHDVAPNVIASRLKNAHIDELFLNGFLDRGTFMKPEGADGELLKGG